MGIMTTDKEERNYQAFMNELEKLSKKYGIGISGCGVFDYWDENGFKEIEYRKDSSSGDLRIEKLVFSDGTSLDDQEQAMIELNGIYKLKQACYNKIIPITITFMNWFSNKFIDSLGGKTDE